MNGGALAAAFMSAGGLALLGVLWLEPRAERRRLARRIALVRPDTEPLEALADVSARRLRTEDILRRAFTFGLEQSWGVRSAGTRLLAVSLLTAAGTAMLGAILLRGLGPAVPAAAIALGYAAGRVMAALEQRQAEAGFLEHFPQVIDMIIRMLRAGLPITAAIRVVADEAPEAVGQVFQNIADQLEIGVGLAESLTLATRRIRLADFRFFAVSIALQHSTGGNLTATLEILSEIIRRRRAVRLKSKALTAEVRMSSYVLGAIPLLLLVGLFLLTPHYFDPILHDPRGKLILLAAGGSLSLGFLSMRQLMQSATTA